MPCSDNKNLTIGTRVCPSDLVLRLDNFDLLNANWYSVEMCPVGTTVGLAHSTNISEGFEHEAGSPTDSCNPYSN